MLLRVNSNNKKFKPENFWGGNDFLMNKKSNMREFDDFLVKSYMYYYMFIDNTECSCWGDAKESKQCETIWENHTCCA